jgi:hypothetical protein
LNLQAPLHESAKLHWPKSPTQLLLQKAIWKVISWISMAVGKHYEMGYLLLTHSFWLQYLMSPKSCHFNLGLLVFIIFSKIKNHKQQTTGWTS